MNTTAPNSPKHWWRVAVRWILAVAILWFLGSRLVDDWPAVRAAADSLRYGWLAIGVVPGLLYFPLRVAAWRSILNQVGVLTSFGQAARVWMNGEIIRYIPGNVWSVLGRVAQAEQLGTSRAVVFASMVLETLLLLLASAGVSAVGLMVYAAYDFPGRSFLLLGLVGLTVVAAAARWLNVWLRLVERLLRRSQGVGRLTSSFRPFTQMTLSWIAYALFQLAVAMSLGAVPNGPAAIALIGIFTLSWLIGYVSFITPSGLGVREVVLVWLLRPYVDQPTALLIAVMSRVLMIFMELAVFAAVHVSTRPRRIA